MKRTLVIATLSAALLTAAASPAAAATGAAYLRAHQLKSGGLAETGGVAGITLTEWGVMALRAAGSNPTTMHRPGGKTPVSYLAGDVRHWTNAYSIERGILAAVALRKSPTTFGGRNLITALRNLVTPSTGRIGAYANSTYWGALALRGANQKLPTHTVRFIETHQQTGGGWSYLPQMPAGADSNDTSAAILALHAAGVACSNTHVKRGLAYLASVHVNGGGYPLLAHGAADSQSTAWAVQARRSCGLKNTAALKWLAARHAADGSYYYAPGNHQTPVFVTGQVLPATNSRWYPIR